MKNLFFVINKEKIYAYVVSIMTIVTIFFMSSIINTDLKETELTSSNSIENSKAQETSAIGEAISTSTPYNATDADNQETGNTSAIAAEAEVEENTTTGTNVEDSNIDEAISTNVAE